MIITQKNVSLFYQMIINNVCAEAKQHIKQTDFNICYISR